MRNRSLAVISLAVVMLMPAALASSRPAEKPFAYETPYWVSKSIPGVSAAITDIQVMSGNPSRLAAVVAGATNLCSSQDGGVTWKTFASETGKAFVALTESKTVPGEFFAMDTNPDLYWSNNAGETWIKLSTVSKPPNPIPPANDLDGSANRAKLVVATGAGADTRQVYYTNNAGGTWDFNAVGPAAVWEVVAGDPTNENSFFASQQGTGTNTVYSSANAGVDWAVCPGALPAAVHVSSIAVLPNNGPVLVATDTPGAPSCMYRTNDRGTIWSASGPGFPAGTAVNRVVVSNASPYVSLAATSTGVFISYDGGSNWSGVSGNLPAKDYRSVSTSSGSDGTIYTGTSDGGIYKMGMPVLTGVTPNSGPQGKEVTLTGVNLGDKTDSSVTFGGATATEVVSWTESSVVVKVPAGALSGNVVVTTPNGRSNGISFTVIPVIPTSSVWYLAEGSTGKDAKGSFETWVLVQNPNSVAATATLTYMTPTGARSGPTVNLEPNTRQTVKVSDAVPETWSVSTKVESDQPVIAERSIYWNAPDAYRRAATDSIGVPAPSTTWYLAEGSTGKDDKGSFETWVLVQNPNSISAVVKLTYMTPSGAKDGPVVTLEPNTRQTVNVADTVPETWSVSTKVDSDHPVVAERSIYWNSTTTYRQAATDSIGTAAPAATWYLAEGSTGKDDRGSFETWVLVQNPNNAPATAVLTYMTPAGAKAGPTLNLGANSRQTVKVSDNVPETWSVSTKVESNQPVIAERSIYWSTSSTYRLAATDSIGVAAASTTWYLAEGSTGRDDQGAFETWVLVQNPNSAPATVRLTYMTPSGAKDGPVLTLAANTRQTVNVSDVVPDTWSVSTKVESDIPVIAERSIYWNAVNTYRQAATDSIGVSH